MAKFSFNGMDKISASFEQLAQITDEDKEPVLRAGANVFAEYQIEKIKAWFIQRSGDLADSITIQIEGAGEDFHAHIYPKGKHKGSSIGRRMKKENGRRRSSGNYSGTNAEVAYILNYGSPRIAATHWLEYANEEAEEEAMEDMEYAWDEVLEAKGL